MSSALQIAGALLVLVPFVWSQVGSMRTDAWVYLTLNLIGSALLAVLALTHEQWGFLLLEGTWALVAAWSVARLPRRG